MKIFYHCKWSNEHHFLIGKHLIGNAKVNKLFNCLYFYETFWISAPLV